MAKQKKKSNRLIIYLFGAVGVLLLVIIIGKSQGWIGKEKQLEVDMAKAMRTTIVEKVSASGTIQPVTEVKIAPEVSGEIIELEIEEGDAVAKGASLVKIRPDTWESQLQRARASLNQQYANLEQAKASLSRAEATLIRATADYERQKKLHTEKVISDADWQLADQNYKIALQDKASAEQSVKASEAVINSTKASLREAEENFRKTEVLAPMDGIVSKLIVKKGERVVGTATMAGTEMLRIADLNVMEVRVDVNENDIVRVHNGDTAIIDVDAYSNQNKKFKGIVTLIANTAKEKLSADAITEFEVRILMLQSSYEDLIKEGSKYPFRPGMTASVDIITKTKSNVLSVPLSSVTTRNDNEKKETDKPDENAQSTATSQGTKKEENKVIVFINDNGVAKKVEVETGISDYDNIEITSGISDSTEVVTGPFLVVSKGLKDGDKITQTQKKDMSKEE